MDGWTGWSHLPLSTHLHLIVRCNGWMDGCLRHGWMDGHGLVAFHYLLIFMRFRSLLHHAHIVIAPPLSDRIQYGHEHLVYTLTKYHHKVNNIHSLYVYVVLLHVPSSGICIYYYTFAESSSRVL